MIRETELISLKDGKTKNLTEFVKDLAPAPEPIDLTPTTPVDTGGADPVALSSYIDGIADTSATDAINAGLGSGGSIANAISSGASAAASAAITEELGTGGDIANAIDNAVSGLSFGGKFVPLTFTTNAINFISNEIIDNMSCLIITGFERISNTRYIFPTRVFTKDMLEAASTDGIQIGFYYDSFNLKISIFASVAKTTGGYNFYLGAYGSDDDTKYYGGYFLK